MRIFFLILFIFSIVSVNASETKQVENVMMLYLKAIKSKNLQQLKKITTPKYFEILNKDDGLKKLFAMQTDDKKPIVVDIKVVKQKENYRANIKDKTDENFDDYWFNIILVDGKLKIDGTFHLEEPQN